MKWHRQIYPALRHLVYPQRCLVCGDDVAALSSDYLCFKHQRLLHLIDEHACEQCGQQLIGLVDGESCCSACRISKRYFQKGYTLARYDDSMKALIHAFKYDKRRYLKYPLGHMLYQGLLRAVDYGDIDLIMPVPLHVLRFFQRRFNQALELSRVISPKLGIPIVSKNLKRVRYTRPQARLDSTQRAQNIRGAFRVKRPAAIKSKHVLLIDDVCTTGNTMNECARVLHKAGARAVSIAVLAQPLR